MKNCKMLYTSGYYDEPIAGLCYDEDGELLAFELKHDFELDESWYEGSYLSNSDKKKLLEDKLLFETHVGFHWSYDKESNLVHPEDQWHKFYSNREQVIFDWNSTGRINLTSK